jgi:AbiJ N-terminal domain 4
MKFSERRGLVQVRKSLQKDEMSKELRASLWNVLHRVVFSAKEFFWLPSSMGYDRTRGAVVHFARELWDQHFKQPLDEIPFEPRDILEVMKSRFFGGKWYDVYDYLEAVLRISESKQLAKELNLILERELAGFRVVTGHFAEVVSEHEVAAIEAATSDDRFPGVVAHLSQAVQHLANRKTPDYRNSVKESISAVESMAQVLTGQKGTLGDTLKVLEKHGTLHKALKSGFSSLYGYTSDAEGIRHAMLEEGTIGHAEAMYFLVSCSAFINFLKSKMPP